MRLDAGDRVEHRHRAVEDTHGAFHLDGEIHMAGRVDDIDAVIVPETGGRGRSDGDAAFLFLFHEIHGGGAVMDFADLMGSAGVIKNALRRRRLAGIDMRGNADISVAVERGLSGH